MVDAKDKDLMTILKNDQVFVCFREGEDTFSLISFDEPLPSQYKSNPKAPSLLTTDGYIFYSRFAKGLSDDFKIIPGEWTRIAAQKPSSAVEDMRTFADLPPVSVHEIVR